MERLTNVDLHWVVSRLPKDVVAAMKKDAVMLGGGFIRATIAGERPADIDLFSGDATALKAVADKLAHERKRVVPYTRTIDTPNAVTVLSAPRLPLQFITRWLYAKAEDLMRSFDFTICQAVVWWDGTGPGCWDSVVSDSFYTDLAARRLVYTSPQRAEDAGGSLLRVRKYLARGYNIQAGSLARVVARLVQGVVKPERYTEDALGNVLTGLLREVDPLTVIDGIDLVDEHAPIQ